MTSNITLKGALLLLALFVATYGGFRYGPQLLIMAQSERSRPPTGASSKPGDLNSQEIEEVMDKRFDGNGLGVVIATALNVRNSPGLTGGKLGVLYCGDVVKLSPPQGGWYPVEVGALRGFSHGAYLFPIAPGGTLPTCKDSGTRQTQKAPTEPTRSQSAPVLSQGAPNQALAVAPEPPPAPKSKPKPKATPRGPVKLILATAGRAKAVSFPHHDHNQMFGCAQCHHPLEAQGSQANSEKECRSCHGVTASSGLSSITAKEVMHKTCQGCHQAQAAGPQKCSGCHTGS